MKKGKLYWQLFLSTFQLSAFTFGGGFVIIPLMRKKFVEKLHWLEEEEMLDLTAIAQSAPGAIAVNASILVGYRIAGVLGALVTVLGTVLPPLLILSAISYFYVAFQSNRIVQLVLKGMGAGVIAIIFDAVSYTHLHLGRLQHGASVELGQGFFVSRHLPLLLLFLSSIASFGPTYAFLGLLVPLQSAWAS